MRAANVLLLIGVACGAVSAAEPERILGMALAEAQLGRCDEALAHLDQYLAASKEPSPDAFEVLRRCPRGAPASPPPVAAPAPAPVVAASAPAPVVATPVAAPAKKTPRPRFVIDIEAGVNVPLTSSSLQAAFLGSVELGVALSQRLGLTAVLLGESLVSRAVVTADGRLSTVFSENLLAGVEMRRVVWRRLGVFGTVAAGILVDSYRGFRSAVALHADGGIGWRLGPGELRLRPLSFGVLVETDGTAGASWRATAGYALRF